MGNILTKNILSTIAYYDVMDYPMTSFEIWKYLISDNEDKRNNDFVFSLAEAVKELEKEEIKKYIEEYRGFYFFKGRKNLIEQRIERNKISDSKIKKAKKVIFWLRFIPFIKMIAVTGRVGAKNAQSKSDIDVFIIFQHDKIFTGRFLVTVLVYLFGQRRYGNKINNRICLNHFLSDRFSVSIQDLYSSHSYIFAIPIYGGKVFQKFLEKNQWIKKYRLNFSFLENNIKETKDSKISIGIRKFLEIIFALAWIEKKLKIWQIKKIKNNPLTKKKEGVIIYSDFELAFWPDFKNQGPKVFEKFKEKLVAELDKI